jgi:hypothetical protein
LVECLSEWTQRKHSYAIIPLIALKTRLNLLIFSFLLFIFPVLSGVLTEDDRRQREVEVGIIEDKLISVSSIDAILDHSDIRWLLGSRPKFANSR